MIFFKKKTPKEEAPLPEKPKMLQETTHVRLLTAEGWRRRAIKKKKVSK